MLAEDAFDGHAKLGAHRLLHGPVDGEVVANRAESSRGSLLLASLRPARLAWLLGRSLGFERLDSCHDPVEVGCWLGGLDSPPLGVEAVELGCRMLDRKLMTHGTRVPQDVAFVASPMGA